MHESFEILQAQSCVWIFYDMRTASGSVLKIILASTLLSFSVRDLVKRAASVVLLLYMALVLMGRCYAQG